MRTSRSGGRDRRSRRPVGRSALCLAFLLAWTFGVSLADEPTLPSGMSREVEQTDTENTASGSGSSETNEESPTHKTPDAGDKTKQKDFKYGQGNSHQSDPAEKGADHVTITAGGGSVRSSSFISDSGGDEQYVDPVTGVKKDGSLVQGAGTSATKLEASVSKENCEVYLFFTNDVVHKRDYKSLGKEYREVDNFVSYRMIDNVEDTWKVKILYIMGSSYTHTYTVTEGDNATTEFAVLPKVQIAGNDSESDSTSTTTGQDKPIVGAPDLHDVATVGPIKGPSGSVSHTVKWASTVSQLLIADGIKNQSLAETTFKNYSLIQTVWADYGFIAEPGPDPQGSSTVVWAGGEPDPGRFEKVGKPSFTNVYMAALPRGLSGEPNHKRGMLMVAIPNTSTEEWTVEFSVSPAGAVSLVSEIGLEPGTAITAVPVTGELTGAFTITADVLDDQDNLVESYEAAGTCASLTALSDVILNARIVNHRDLTPELSGALDATTVLPSGSSGVTVMLTREPFDDMDTEATVVALSVDDPSGILAGVPSSVTIPAGESQVAFEFDMSGSLGEASLSFSSPGVAARSMALRASAQAFTTPVTELYLPASTRVPYEFGLRHVSDFASGLGYNVTLSDPSLSTQSLLDVGYFVAGATTVGIFEVSAGGTPGDYTMTIADSAGALTSVTVPVHVRASDFSASRSTISLSDMALTEGGDFVIHAPEGVEFDSASGPAGSSAYLTVTGTGTETLTLTFSEGVARPNNIDIAITLSGTGGQPFDLVVNDSVRPNIPAHAFVVEVP